MPKLNRALLSSPHVFPANLQVDRPTAALDLPERVLQFGEGNFLRGFVDWMIHKLNQKNLFQGKIVVVQPIAQGLVDKLNEQNGLYTLLLRGIQNGQVLEQREIIASISRGLNPYADFPAFMACAENPDLRFIVSNTTEAGIAFNPHDKLTDTPPASFPGKLTALLYRRYQHFHGDAQKGFILLPCELIERNGDNLRRAVLQTAEHWQLPPAFLAWIEKANTFTNTLVDRIVTGYPRDEAAKITAELGYEDALLDTGEIFHFWAIEGDPKLADELPLHKLGLDVVWTDNLKPYRDRKVRILNGAHTMTVLAAYLAGKETVKDCLDDPIIAKYMRHGLEQEILPTLDLPKPELDAFAAAVSERFANPFIRHYLLSIALNSTSKFKARVLPSLQEYHRRTGKLPKRLAFAMAALIAFYQGTELRDAALIGHRNGQEYKIQDDPAVLELFQQVWRDYDGTRAGVERLVSQVLAASELWGCDLNMLDGLAELITRDVHTILPKGAKEALKTIA